MGAHMMCSILSQLGRLRALTNILLESECPLCGRSASQKLCLGCQRQVLACQIDPAVSSWGLPLNVFAWGHYEGALKRAIAALKYDQQPQIAHLLGQWAGKTWLKLPQAQMRSLTVVPIPMHRDKQRQRGYNQAELLAAGFCQITQLPLYRDGLLRVKATQAQFSLSPTERAHNMADAFQVNPLWAAKPPSGGVLLLDDVYTTGATVAAATTQLRRHRIRVYGAVAIAQPTQFKKDEQ